MIIILRRIKAFSANETIYQEGDTCEFVYIITEGEVRHVKRIKDEVGVSVFIKTTKPKLKLLLGDLFVYSKERRDARRF